MSKFATGRNSYAISDRSGFRYRYRDMRKEWNGLLVGRDEFEAKQPQLGPFRKVNDPEALKDARPDIKENLDVYVGIPLVEEPQPRPTRAFGFVGVVIFMFFLGFVITFVQVNAFINKFKFVIVHGLLISFSIAASSSILLLGLINNVLSL